VVLNETELLMVVPILVEWVYSVPIVMLSSIEVTLGTPTEKLTVSDVLNVLDMDQFPVLETSYISIIVTSNLVAISEVF
jgi:hypothetical protein